MNKLFELSKHRINNTSDTFSRYLLAEIDFNQRLIGIKGARGTGKTTLLLQKLKQLASEDALYISMDNVYFSANSLLDLAEEFYRIGGKYLYIDEVHKYPNWSQEIKNIYDNFTELKLVFTGSSALEITQAAHDLSRRALVYELSGMSFREFLFLKYGMEFPAYSLNDILYHNKGISEEVLARIKPYKYFKEYLQLGYYPYSMEDEINYHLRLEETINLVLEVDLPAIYKIEYSSIIKLKRLLFVIASLVPYIPNINKLAKQIGTTRDSLLKYLHLLHKAHILRWISKEAWGINFMNKPDKLFLDNTNIAYALNYDQINVGNIRETFFVNQLSVKHKLIYSPKADFLVDGKYTFEIGGKNKTAKQIQGMENAFLVQDDIEFGYQNRIPLWMFGFLY